MKNKKTIALAMAAATVAPMAVPAFADEMAIPFSEVATGARTVNVRTANSRELNKNLVHEDNIDEFFRKNANINPKKVGKVFIGGKAYYAVEVDMDLTDTVTKNAQIQAANKFAKLKKELETLKAEKYNNKDRYKFEVRETMIDYDTSTKKATEGYTEVWVTDTKYADADVVCYKFNGVYSFNENDIVDTEKVVIDLSNGTEDYKELAKCIFKLQQAKGKIYTTTSINKNENKMTINVFRTDKKVQVGSIVINSFDKFKQEKLDKWTIPADCDFAGHWAEKEIIEAMYSGQVALTGTFRPKENITRAEFASMVCKVYKNKIQINANTNKNIKFTDVQNEDWFYDSVMKLAKAGHINGYTNGTFKPQATITRQEAAAILASIAGVQEEKWTDVNGNEIHKDVITKFDDDKSIATWADESVKALSEDKVIVGYKEGKKEYFKPANKIQRVEALVMMQRGEALVK